MKALATSWPGIYRFSAASWNVTRIWRFSSRSTRILLSHAWLIVSDSGGVQEEAPTLGKPLLILRENTERPEVVESGVARLVGGSPENLANLLEEAYGRGSWADRIGTIKNPFGRGDSGEQIARIIVSGLVVPQAEVASGGVGRDE